MKITVSSSFALQYLSFARHAWQLSIPNLPEISPRPNTRASARPDGVPASDAVEQWRREWAMAWEQWESPNRTVRVPDAETLAILDAMSDEQLLDSLPTAPSEFWAEGIDRDEFDAWSRTLVDDHSLPLEQHPERLCLDALIPAWRSGVNTIVQLPYAGYFAERVTPNVLAVSTMTRQDPDLYRHALQST